MVRAVRPWGGIETWTPPEVDRVITKTEGTEALMRALLL
jgi:hypothetical protein